MARISKQDEGTLNEFGFEFSAPPERSNHRRSRHHERFVAARELLMKYEGQSLKVMEYNTQSSAYTTAKKINNGDNAVFPDFHDWKAVAAPVMVIDEEDNEVESGSYGVWLTYEPHTED